MFTNTFSINPFPLFPSSSYPPLYLNHENSETFLLDPMVVPFIPSDNNVYSIPQTTINFPANHCKPNEVNRDHYGVSGLLGRKPAKKDRHSKIYTAQGVRDRRVRLSIGIARKFFDLQDMLGFDKASRTLEWLLKNSKKAIQELALKKQSYGEGAKSLSPPSECEVVSGINDCEDPAERFRSSIKSLLVEVNEDKPLKRTLSEIAKESRAKARARARERTRDKMSTRFHDSFSSRVPQVFHHSRSAEASIEKSTKSVAEIEDLPGAQVTKEKVLEDPIVIKRKSMQSLISSYHQNPTISEDARHNNCIFPNCTPNWNVSGATSHTSLCAVTNTNLNTELQMFGKPWEAYEGQRLP